MNLKRFCRIVLLAALASIASLAAQTAPTSTPAPATTPAPDHILLTIFLRHDQSKTLTEINQQLKESQFWKKFPPAGIEVESWYVMMGIGQVVTLRVPPARLREVNRAIEESAWGAFRTEFYPTYDFRAIAGAQLREARK